MEEKLLVIKHKDLVGRTLTVPKEVSEDGKLVLDENGQATLPANAAHFLCTVPGFSLVSEQQELKNDNVEGLAKETDQEHEKTDLHTDATNEGQADNLEQSQNQVAADDNLNQASENDDKTDQELEATDEEAKIKPKYPEGDPNPSWKKEELATWLEEKMIEFKPKDGKEVLLGKAFKYLENTNSIDEPQKERG